MRRLRPLVHKLLVNKLNGEYSLELISSRSSMASDKVGILSERLSQALKSNNEKELKVTYAEFRKHFEALHYLSSACYVFTFLSLNI